MKTGWDEVALVIGYWVLIVGGCMGGAVLIYGLLVSTWGCL